MYQVEALNTFKEKHTSELKSYKERIEGLIKSFNAQIDSQSSYLKSHSCKMLEESEKTFKSQLEKITRSIYDVRVENSKYAADMKKSSGELIKERDAFVKDKEKYETGICNLRIANDDINENINILKSEQDSFNRKFSELTESIKNINKLQKSNINISGYSQVKRPNKTQSTTSFKKLMLPNFIAKENDKTSFPESPSTAKKAERKVKSVIRDYIIGKEGVSSKAIQESVNDDNNTGNDLNNINNNNNINNTYKESEEKYFYTNNNNNNNKNEKSKKGDCSTEIENAKISANENLLDLEIKLSNNLINKIPSSEQVSNNKYEPRSILRTNNNKKALANSFSSESSFNDIDNTNYAEKDGKLGNCKTSNKISPNFKFCDSAKKDISNFCEKLNVSSKKLAERPDKLEKQENLPATNWALDKLEKEEAYKKEFLDKDLNSLISKLKASNGADSQTNSFLNSFVNIILSLNENSDSFKKELIKKIGIEAYKIEKLEYFFKKKLEELTTQIKAYIPISFNPYIKVHLDKKKLDATNQTSNIQNPVNVEEYIYNDIIGSTGNFNLNIVDSNPHKMFDSSPFESNKIKGNIFSERILSSRGLKQITSSQIIFNSKTNFKK